MSTPLYGPLREVPPAGDDQARWAWLLRVRRWARKAADVALAVPRKATGYISRLLHSLHLQASVSWLRRLGSRLTRPVLTLASRLGRSGCLAGVTAILASPTGQALATKTGRLLGRGVSWLASRSYGLLDQGLRCFGTPGNKAADLLFAVMVSIGGRIAGIAAPVVHRVARFTDPASPQARLVAGVSRSFLLHRLLKAVVSNTWLRAVTEAVLIPAVLDSRLLAWARKLLGQAKTRAQELREQTATLADLASQPAYQDELWDVAGLEEPVPANRAERRAAQRQGKRPQH